MSMNWLRQIFNSTKSLPVTSKKLEGLETQKTTPQALTLEEERAVKKAVERTVSEYGEALRKMGND